MTSKTAILFENAPITEPLSLATIHACNSSSPEEEKIISPEVPLPSYFRISSANTRNNVELSELQAPASGLGIGILGVEDKKLVVRLRDAVAENTRCSVVATASVVIVGGEFSVGSNGRDEIQSSR